MKYETRDRKLFADGVAILTLAIVSDENGARAIDPHKADVLIRAIPDALNAPEKEKYNGWTNRETWALKLHLDNTESSQAWLSEVAALAGENAEATEYRTLEQAKLYTTEDAIKDAVETAFERALNPVNLARGHFDASGVGESIGLWDAGDVFRMVSDVGSLWRVNWREIAEHVIEENAEA